MHHTEVNNNEALIELLDLIAEAMVELDLKNEVVQIEEPKPKACRVEK